MPDDEKSQVVEPEIKAEEAEVIPQPEAEVMAIPPEAEVVTPRPALPKTYTEEELALRVAGFQAEAARAQEIVNRLTMQQQIRAVEEAEKQAVAKDQQAVEQGLITESEAGQRQQLRGQTAYLQYQAAQLQQFIQQQAIQGEPGLRMLGALKVARKYGVNPDELINDNTLTSSVEMEIKALKLVIAGLRQKPPTPESFDKGPTGTLTKGTSADRVIRAYGEGDPSVKRADYEKAMQDKGLL